MIASRTFQHDYPVRWSPFCSLSACSVSIFAFKLSPLVPRLSTRATNASPAITTHTTFKTLAYASTMATLCIESSSSALITCTSPLTTCAKVVAFLANPEYPRSSIAKRLWNKVLLPYPLRLSSNQSDFRSTGRRIWPHGLRRSWGFTLKRGFKSGSRYLYATDVTPLSSHGNRFKNVLTPLAA